MDRKILKDSRIHTGWNDIPNSFFMAEKLRVDYKNGFYGLPFHFHQYYELYYLLEGSCVHIIGKKKYTLNPGDWILIPFDVDHRVYYNSSSHERILLRFTKDYIPYSMLDKVNTILSNPLYIADDKHKEYVYNIMTRFVEEYENYDIYSENICRNLIYELLVLFLRKAPSDYIAETQIFSLMTFLCFQVHNGLCAWSGFFANKCVSSKKGILPTDFRENLINGGIRI